MKRVLRIFGYLPVVTVVLLTASGCTRVEPCGRAEATGGAALSCALTGFDGRPYDVRLPADYRADRPAPVILAIHGGGGNAAGAARTTCPVGDRESPGCLDAMATRKGFAVVYPNGTSSRVASRIRTWNAGGGEGDWQCVSGRACKDRVYDIAYFTALLDDLERWMAVDRRRVFATGLSNGGAMSHRLGCEMADRIAAIAPVGGANQFAATAECAPPRPVPVLQIHGTKDPCWRYGGGVAACAQRDEKTKIAVLDSMQVWARVNDCHGTLRGSPFASEPGVETARMAWEGCRAETVLLRMEGGGHVWPGGWPYLGERIIGPMVSGWSANRVILDFFRRNPMPEQGR